MIRSEHPNKFIWTANNYRWQRNDGTIIKGCEKFLEYNVTINMRGQAVTLNFISDYPTEEVIAQLENFTSNMINNCPNCIWKNYKTNKEGE